MTPQASVIPIGKRCVLCGCKLDDEQRIALGLCDSCERRPEAKRAVARQPAAGNGQGKPAAAPRGFTVPDKSLIRSVHALMPAVDLLRTLNTRLIAHLGPDVPRYTLEQLQAEIQSIPRATDDWCGLRRLLADARRSGVLAAITTQVIDDFCVVWQLSSAQQLHLKDVIRNAQEER